MPQEMQIDGDRLYRDLQDHFGTMKASYETTWHLMPISWVDACLGEIDTAYEVGDWDSIIEMALNEGFNLDQYAV